MDSHVINKVFQLSIVNLLSVFVLMQNFLYYYPNYPTHRVYFGEVETPYLYIIYVIYLQTETHRQIRCWS